jgi:hypothetical protein
MIISKPCLTVRVAAAAITVVYGVLTGPAVDSVQAATPSLLDRGAGAALYGRCQADVLRNDMLRPAAVLGAFAPDAVNRLVERSDEMTVLALMCAHQIHQHRCSAKIVAVAGDVLVGSRPAGKAMPSDKPNPGAVLGGTVGALGGLLLGTAKEDVGTGLGAAIVGGAVGYQGGGAVFNKAQMNACIRRQRELDAISMKLEGRVADISLPSLEALIRSNVRMRAIVQREADLLITEANKLSYRASEVFQAMQ